MLFPRRLAPVVALLGALSCTHRPAVRVRSPSSPAAAVTSRGAPTPSAPGARYQSPAAALDRAAVLARLPSGGRLTPDALLASHAVAFGPDVAADPADVPGMSAIQGGPFALQGAELERLQTHGFALLPRHQRGNFLSGYVGLYLRDQPVYLSADLILNALHEGFDSLITSIETDAVAPALTRALEGLRAALAGPRGAALAAETRVDLDTYLSVALGLLQGRPAAPVAGADAAALADLHARATRAEGTAGVTLFGAPREVDLSQMRPRGHYAGVPAREQYFRAVMWLGREGLRLVDVVEGRRVLSRRSLAAALGLRALSDEGIRTSLRVAEQSLAGFAGEPEALTGADLDALSTQLAAAGRLDALPDARVLEVIDGVRGDRPRVATAMLVRPESMVGTVPMPVTFSLTPQRYTPDSMVLSRVSFDRVDGGRVPRMMPDALDAAFAAMGNDQAAALLRPSLDRHDYATELETARTLVDAHESSYWNGSLYASWMSSLRTLSPRETLSDGSGLPAVMATEAWGRRLLNTQLAAWAEVRHDTILYTAQSYSMSLGCSYPSAYVDPYPALWAGLSRWVERARAVAASSPWATPAEGARWAAWSNRAADVVARLQAIAERERAGQDLTSEQLEWVNRALNAREVNAVCTTEVVVDGGWLYELYEPRQHLGQVRGIVADVHTQPDDEAGNRVGRVLHIGTGPTQAMVVLAGPPGRERAYMGFASSYRERVTENFDRIDDERWRREMDRATAPAWMAPITAPGGR